MSTCIGFTLLDLSYSVDRRGAELLVEDPQKQWIPTLLYPVVRSSDNLGSPCCFPLIVVITVATRRFSVNGARFSADQT